MNVNDEYLNQLRDLDAAPFTSLTDDQRARSEDSKASILASTFDEEKRPITAIRRRRGQTPLRRALTIGILTATSAAVAALIFVATLNVEGPAPVVGASPTESPLAATEQATPTETTAVTEAPQPTYETDAYGVRYWDINSDRNEIVYEEGARGMTLAEQQLAVEQGFIVAKCMDEQGFDYRFQLPWQTHPDDRGDVNPNTYEVGDPYYVALWGEYGQTGEYDWTQAGCEGLATHETGQDGAN
ncbi:anti-sigma factor [Pseudoclavibacter sp. Z016]|uniref:anti-sigma factor n=1 Tax=Pseudoclavibacter sp. Z016 TaxID=2080581 RepID=UPI000CE81D24|nr:anti-sigma factor [Pseudoclavibacter sp. Z016]PPF72605.1 hypothetical protein C5B99_17340 [Pseudoclavibacter sp. Z016]